MILQKKKELERKVAEPEQIANEISDGNWRCLVIILLALIRLIEIVFSQSCLYVYNILLFQIRLK